MFDNFWKFTEQFVDFTNQEKAQIKQRLIVRDVPKGYVLVEV